MRGYADFLVRSRFTEQVELAVTLTVLELPNFFVLLEQAQRAGDAEATIHLAASLYSLLKDAGKARLLERLARIRDAAAAALEGTWNNASFKARATRIEEQLASSRLGEALDGARQLLQRARAAGEEAYPGTDYDLAVACFLLARVLKGAGSPEQSLPLLEEAQKRFETIAREAPSRSSERMASVCLADLGDCLRDLGRLDQAVAAYEESIRRAEKIGDARQVAVGKGQLGTVRHDQRRYKEALAAYQEARELFTRLEEPGTVAVFWHQTGMVYEKAKQPEAAEDAYRKSLEIEVRLGNVGGQASTLLQLGNLYSRVLGRLEEAVAFYRQAADKYVEIRDAAREGAVRNNVAETLRRIRLFDEARLEILRAIKCKAQFGHGSLPWTSWAILTNIETDAGNATAAGEAKGRAVASYLAYRRDGGENHYLDGRICLDVTRSLLAGDPAAAAFRLQELARDAETPASIRPLIQALQAIVAGVRDPTLVHIAGLNYAMAAEILFLLETLEKRP
jgi:tetratricopeptide (TPR) repeat protein